MTETNDLGPDQSLETASEPARNPLETASESNSKLRKCAICNFIPEIAHRTSLIHSHHIQPRRFGGSNHSDNLMDVCLGCHALIHVLINAGRIDKKYVQSRFIYTRTETINTAQRYLEQAKKRLKTEWNTNTRPQVFGRKNRDKIATGKTVKIKI